MLFIQELASEISKLENFSDENWRSDWLAKCLHMNSKIKIPTSDEELFFHGIDHTGAALLKHINGEVFAYQESSLSVLTLSVLQSSTKDILLPSAKAEGL